MQPIIHATDNFSGIDWLLTAVLFTNLNSIEYQTMGMKVIPVFLKNMTKWQIALACLWYTVLKELLKVLYRITAKGFQIQHFLETKNALLSNEPFKKC